MAAAIATTLLKQAAGAAAGAAGTAVFQKGLDYVSGGSEYDKLQQSISDVLKQVQDVKVAVEGLSKKLDEGIIRLRKDTLGNPLNDIESYYYGVQDCLNQALSDKKEIQDKAKLQEALTKLQSRLEDHLKLAANNVAGYLSRVNDFLQDPDFLKTSANLALQGSNDFIAYYMKMKLLFLPYWVVVVKGITLLEMARLAPKVSFGEAPQTIKRHTELLKGQEKTFSEVVGNNTCQLAEWFLAAPGSRRPVIFLSGWGSSIGHTNEPINSLYRFDVPQARDGDPYRKYFFEVTTTLSAQNFDLSKSYPMVVHRDGHDDHMALDNGRLPVHWYWGGGGPDDTWYIKPVSIGTDHYRFVNAAGRYANAVLVVGWHENKLEWRYNIDPNKGLDDNPPRAYFQVVPWRD